MKKKVFLFIYVVVIALLFIIFTNRSYYEKFDNTGCNTVDNKEYNLCEYIDVNNVRRYNICKTDYVPQPPPTIKCLHGKIVNKKNVCAKLDGKVIIAMYQ